MAVSQDREMNGHDERVDEKLGQASTSPAPFVHMSLVGNRSEFWKYNARFSS